MSGQLRTAPSLDAAVASGGEGRPITLAETLADDDDHRRVRRSPAVERRDLAIDLDQVISGLHPHLRQVCQWLKTHTREEVAKMAGICPGTLDRRIGAIRRAFEAAGQRD
jgi:DNA-directed RNA polymerase specialized sigma24 family protein